MIKKIVKCKNPEILAITPLKIGDKISKETKKSVKRNKTSFEWISYMSNNNPYKNTSIAYKQYKREHKKVPKYVIKIDNDIMTSRYWLDRMYNILEETDSKIGYAYTSFEFTGAISIKFPLKSFNKQSLTKSNYISSCSLTKTQLLDQIGGFVTDDKYFRLLDWCVWLKFLKSNIIGIPTPNANFVAYAKPSSISCKGPSDYKEKYYYVKKDFIDPLIF